MENRVSLSFSIKYAKLSPLMVREGSLSLAERSSLATFVTYINATVTYVPPLLVLPRSNVNAELLDSPPPVSIAFCHKAGWIQKDSFTQRFKYFVRYVKPSKKDPVILTLDGYCSHLRNVEVLDYARDNGVHIFCPPPHSKTANSGSFFI